MKGNGGILGPLNSPTTNSAPGVWSLRESIRHILANNWPSVSTGSYNAQYLIVAAGAAGGGHYRAGGGGAGDLDEGTLLINSGQTYTFTIGVGGQPVAGDSGTAGNDSSLDAITVPGGGPGGKYGVDGGPGGNGGGGGGLSGGAGVGGLGNPGNDGGDGSNGSAQCGGGGAGAGSPGFNGGSGPDDGNGGDGVTSTIITPAIASAHNVGEVIGSDVWFCGGGSAGSYDAGNDTTPGKGGGGKGPKASYANGGDAMPNTGGGGGGSSGATAGLGGVGSDGVGLLRIPTANYTGVITGSPIVVTEGLDTILIFKTSGTYTG